MQLGCLGSKRDVRPRLLPELTGSNQPIAGIRHVNVVALERTFEIVVSRSELVTSDTTASR